MRPALAIAAVALAGCTAAAPQPPALSTAAPASAPSVAAPGPTPPHASPPPRVRPTSSPCDVHPPVFDDPGRLEDDIATPGTATALQVGGLPPGARFEVWQLPAEPAQPCDVHPRDAGGVRLGEATAGPAGWLRFPFVVADVPAGRPTVARSLQLLPVAGGPARHAITWTGATRGRVAGQLRGDDGLPNTRAVTVTARFETDQGLLMERTGTFRGGDYAFDDVLVPVRTTVRVFEDGWLLASGGDQAGGLDFPALPLWEAPLPLPSPAPSVVSAPAVVCRTAYALDRIQGAVDDETAFRRGDAVTLRVRHVPPSTTFTVWQTGSIAGHKDSCAPDPVVMGGAAIGKATSDARGHLQQRLRLADVDLGHPFKETLLWLVWPNDRTMELATRWDVLLPTELGGRLFDMSGVLFTGAAEVELITQVGPRLVRRTTTASGGAYRFDDVPLPADVELVVRRGDRRIGRHHIARDSFLMPNTDAEGHLPKRGPAVTIDFGGPGGTTPWLRPAFPLMPEP